MMMLRLTEIENSFLMTLRQILSSGYDKGTKSDMICEHVLTNFEISYLNYLRGRYGLSENEYNTILAGETLGQGQVKSPAGYQGVQNRELIVQMFYATMLCGPAYQGYVQQLVRDFFYPFCSGMKGVTLQSSTFRLISENMNSCLKRWTASVSETSRWTPLLAKTTMVLLSQSLREAPTCSSCENSTRARMPRHWLKW